jgi:uncharacterized OB-fold protein
MVERIPIKPGLIIERAEGNALLGSRCKDCNKIFFPPTAFCYECLSVKMEEVTLSRTGKLYSYTISYMASSNFKPPHALGWIELPEGIKIASPLREWENKRLRVGMDMELVIGKLWEEQDREIIGYWFQPVS